MARIIGGIDTSHVPTIGPAVDRGKQNDPDWAPLFAGYAPVVEWLTPDRRHLARAEALVGDGVPGAR